jgi:carbonic anhydrase
LSNVRARLRVYFKNASHAATIDADAKIQAGLLSDASPIIAGAIKDGKLKVVAARYNVATGAVALLG